MAIQGLSEQAVNAEADIEQVMQDVRTISETIAATAEQQSSATSSVNHLTDSVAAGFEESTMHLEAVGNAATGTDEAATRVLERSRVLEQQAGNLKEQVASFVADMRAM